MHKYCLNLCMIKARKAIAPMASDPLCHSFSLIPPQISKAARDRLAPVTHIAPLAGFAREVGGFGRALHELLRDVETGRRREVIALVSESRGFRRE